MTTELCPYCGNEVSLEDIQYLHQKCPNCGNFIRPCNLCKECKCQCDIISEKIRNEISECIKSNKDKFVGLIKYSGFESIENMITSIKSNLEDALWALTELFRDLNLDKQYIIDSYEDKEYLYYVYKIEDFTFTIDYKVYTPYIVPVKKEEVLITKWTRL